MAWQDYVVEAEKGEDLRQKPEVMGSTWKWGTFNAYVVVGNSRGVRYDCKIEYTYSGQQVHGITVVGLEDPYADTIVTGGITDYERNRLLDLATHDLEKKCKSGCT